jgi:hypothetical protein
VLCRFVSRRLNGLLSDVFLYLFLGFWGSISVTNLVHISVSRGGASPVGVFSCYFPMREYQEKDEVVAGARGERRTLFRVSRVMYVISVRT